MESKKLLSLISLLFIALTSFAQDSTHVTILEPVTIRSFKIIRGIGRLPEVKEAVIFSGKKNEVIFIDSLDANKAIDNTRQIMGRIPGLNIVETENSGFVANGIATRGLNPTQQIDMNTRQNGYGISADIYGYNESYYIPTMEAVNRIEIVRGAASLQFGPQFGGLVNYILKEAPANKTLEVTTSQTAGSFGLFNSFNSIGGTCKKFSYYAFLQYRNLEGFRPNSGQTQWSGFGKIQYKPTAHWKVGAEYSLFRNKIQMPGGQTDSMFAVNPRQSNRTRNWLKSPWNIVTGTAVFHRNNTMIDMKVNYLFSQRALVWRNQKGGADALDTISRITKMYSPREVEKELMKNVTGEFRLSQKYRIGKIPSVLAAGARISYAWFTRQESDEGTAGSDFDLSHGDKWEENLEFSTTNIAPFVENIFHLTNKLSITPGLRLEYLNSTMEGEDEEEGEEEEEERSRFFPLFGIGAEYKTSENTTLYANFSQAYRPITYSDLEPIGVTSVIDPNMKDSKGYNADAGFRGAIKNYFNFDFGLFYMAYNNRIGIELKKNPTTKALYSYRTNVANSVHQGIESYGEFNFIKYLNPKSSQDLSLFNAFAYTDANYTSGEFKGHRVEAAAAIINRTGLTYGRSHFSGTLQYNYVSDAYGDATNVKTSKAPVAGYIPAYSVWDVNLTYKISKYSIKAGINNLANNYYFTRRTDEYPGPGIIPSAGRSFYVGFGGRF